MLELTLVTFTIYGISALWLKFSDIIKVEDQITKNNSELIKLLDKKNILLQNTLEEKETSILKISEDLNNTASIFEKTISNINAYTHNINRKIDLIQRNENIIEEITDDIIKARTSILHPYEIVKEFNMEMSVANMEFFKKFKISKTPKTVHDSIMKLCEVNINTLVTNKNKVCIGELNVDVFDINCLFLEKGFYLINECMGILEIL